MTDNLAEWMLLAVDDLLGEVRMAASNPQNDRVCAYLRADLEAKRRIVELHTGQWMGPGDPPTSTPYCPLCSRPTRDEDLIRVWPCDTLKLLAEPLADRLGYRAEWRVT